MKVVINGIEHEVDERATLKLALDKLYGSTGNGFAVAVNSHVVPRSEWEAHKLNDDDDILLIRATQGG